VVKRGSGSSFPAATLRVQIFNAKGPLLGFANAVPQMLPLFCWLFQAELIAKPDREIDDAMIKDGALSHEQRQRQLSKLTERCSKLSAWNVPTSSWGSSSTTMPIRRPSSACG
jgi:hypothetical protein